MPLTQARLEAKLEQLMAQGLISQDSRVFFVDDGSKGSTWQLICSYHESNEAFSGLSLSRNCGHQNALLAGLMAAVEQADVAVSIDADLQDDIDAIDQMLLHYHQGIDVVYGVRNDRMADSFFKRTTAHAFYGLMSSLGAETVNNHADFRLMSRRALLALSECNECNLFLRGLVPLIGFPSAFVEYKRTERQAGQTHYPLKRMISLALDGVTSFSIKPLRLIAFLGAIVFLLSIAMLVWAVTVYFRGEAIAGWASTLVSLWAIGGLILLALGIIGEYIGKTYLETKQRPRYFIKETLEEYYGE